jgi:hypothetical protein
VSAGRWQKATGEAAGATLDKLSGSGADWGSTDQPVAQESRTKQTKPSLGWITEHSIGVVVITTVATASGWALGWHYARDDAQVGERTASNYKRSAEPAHLIALSPVQSGVETDRTRSELEEQKLRSDEFDARLSPEYLATQLTQGTDHQRLAAITTALQNGVELPPDLLINAYFNDASDEVRLLAFTTYIDSMSDDVELVRSALQVATNNSSSTVQAEALRRLNELTAYEAAMAEAAAQGIP